jgi:hypothetical protein
MINITYANGGHTLVATKVTGDENVPRGAVTFTVDLAPLSYSGSDAAAGPPTAVAPRPPSRERGLDPIELDADARRRWGRRYLPRHPGRGRVASADFANPQWMEGQMILVGEFFSFAWVPIGMQIFFGRPSAELTIRMMREAEEGRRKGNGGDDAKDRDDVGEMRNVAMSMLEETYWVEKESSDDSVGGDCFGGEGCFE